MSAWAIVAAAGEGSRLGGGPKAFVTLGGFPMLAHPLAAFAKSSVDGIVVVIPRGFEREAEEVVASAAPSTRIEIVHGGGSRQSSVRAGLVALPVEVDRAVVHDAARPLITVGMIEAVLAALEDAPGAIVAVPERDTLKRAGRGTIEETVPRAGLFRAQTPQAFRVDILRIAHDRAVADGFEATDDSMLLERIGERVVIVPGDERNLKVTSPEDLALAEALLSTSWGRS